MATTRNGVADDDLDIPVPDISATHRALLAAAATTAAKARPSEQEEELTTASSEVISSLLDSFQDISSDDRPLRERVGAPDLFPSLDPSRQSAESPAEEPPRPFLDSPGSASGGYIISPYEQEDESAPAPPAPGNLQGLPTLRPMRRPSLASRSSSHRAFLRRNHVAPGFLQSPLRSPVRPSSPVSAHMSPPVPEYTYPDTAPRPRTRNGDSARRPATPRDSMLLAQLRSAKGKDKEQYPSLAATSIEIRAKATRGEDDAPPHTYTRYYTPSSSVYEDDSGLVVAGPSHKSPTSAPAPPSSYRPVNGDVVSPNGAQIPERRSSLHYTPEIPSRVSSRRSSITKKTLGHSRNNVSDISEGDLEGLDPDPDMHEANDTLRRIRELKAAKEQRQKVIADEALTHALASTLPDPDQLSPPSVKGSPAPVANGNPPAPLAPKANMPNGTFRIDDAPNSRKGPGGWMGFSRSKSNSSRAASLRAVSIKDGVRPEISDPIPISKARANRISRSAPASRDENTLRSEWSRANAPPIPDLPVHPMHKRQASTDSVQMGVRAFITSPRLTQYALVHHEGRRVAFSEVGDPKGHAVICCVGMGLTRFVTAFYDELATTLKLRLITLDRPGVGDSDPAGPDYHLGPLQWPDDVEAVCYQLSISRYSLLAHSAGAMYALATALRSPSNVLGKIHLLAPWIPASQTSAVTNRGGSPGVQTGSVPRSHRFLRMIPTSILKLTNTGIAGQMTGGGPRNAPRSRRGAPESGYSTPRISVSRRNPADDGSNASSPMREGFIPTTAPRLEDVVPTPSEHGFSAAVFAAAARAGRPATPRRDEVDAILDADERRRRYDAALTAAVWDMATRNGKPASDLLIALERTQAIGFQYTDIRQRVVIHHGSRDARVPLANAKWLSAVMQNAELRVLDGEGHGLMAVASVMSQVLGEISKEREALLTEAVKEAMKDEEEAAIEPALASPSNAHFPDLTDDVATSYLLSP